MKVKTATLETTLVDGLESWAKATLPVQGTLYRYRYACRLMARHGLKTVRGVTRAGYVQFRDAARAAGRAPQTINGALSACVAVVRWLVDRGELSKTRLRDLKGLFLKVDNPTPDFYTREDFEKLRLAAARVAPWFRIAIEVACLTGVRRGELLRLDLEDFDLERRVLRVRRKVTRGGKLLDTKNHKDRTVSLSPELIALLRERPGTGPLLPARIQGAKSPYLSRRSLDRVTRDISKAAGIKLKWHRCRRSFTTWALRAGISVPEVARALGHSNMDVLYRHYYSFCVGYVPSFGKLLEGAST